MQNWHAIESETAYRHLEWERVATAEARANLARAAGTRRPSAWRALLRRLWIDAVGIAALCFPRAAVKNAVQNEPKLLLNELGCIDAFGDLRH